MEFSLSFSACLWWFLFGGGMMVVMAATSSSSGTTTELDQTPTWAVACVCAVIIIVSILLEKILHKLGTWFTERHKRALFEALEKVKAELMILGFISLLLTFGQTYFIRVCVSPKVANTMLPCAKKETSNASSEDEHRRRLLWLERRSLAAAGSDFKCNDGLEPLMSIEGLHQLHILIFFLALLHVIYSAITMLLGRLKV
ncbi:MLO-like protein 10 [Tripterygium wilfordii]|uniref:MLO-like protein 10 n=1 Tax=Tripterygium wilfordii TaxID=458696 RepID=UPI0018F83449|nr:MLO-like protein 10 [Tripterygium wilfordii]